jgi:aminoglycoside phosphotransferase (APT) family kinase protein
MTLADQLSAYLSRTTGEPVEVRNLARISGGASRETYRYDAVMGGGTRGYILRRDPPGSLIDTDRRVEFLAIRSFEAKDVSAPRAILLEEQGAELQRPFFIMERVDGGTAPSAFQDDPYGAHAQAIGDRFFSIMGTIAGTPIDGLPILEVVDPPAPEDCWRRELDYWSDVIEVDEEHPQPIVRAAIRRLRKDPPPPPVKLAIVHGDYRSGNFLHDGAGHIVALLDWEMAHIGDPLEDLAWAMDPLWTAIGETRVSGMVPRDEALAIWRRASGLEIDPKALKWWSLFASVKGQAIWISAAKEWRASGMTEPILGVSGWYTARRQDQILADQLLAWSAR